MTPDVAWALRYLSRYIHQPLWTGLSGISDSAILPLSGLQALGEDVTLCQSVATSLIGSLAPLPPVLEKTLLGDDNKPLDCSLDKLRAITQQVEPTNLETLRPVLLFIQQWTYRQADPDSARQCAAKSLARALFSGAAKTQDKAVLLCAVLIANALNIFRSSLPGTFSTQPHHPDTVPARDCGPSPQTTAHQHSSPDHTAQHAATNVQGLSFLDMPQASGSGSPTGASCPAVHLALQPISCGHAPSLQVKRSPTQHQHPAMLMGVTQAATQGSESVGGSQSEQGQAGAMCGDGSGGVSGQGGGGAAADAMQWSAAPATDATPQGSGYKRQRDIQPLTVGVASGVSPRVQPTTSPRIGASTSPRLQMSMSPRLQATSSPRLPRSPGPSIAAMRVGYSDMGQSPRGGSPMQGVTSPLHSPRGPNGFSFERFPATVSPTAMDRCVAALGGGGQQQQHMSASRSPRCTAPLSPTGFAGGAPVSPAQVLLRARLLRGVVGDDGLASPSASPRVTLQLTPTSSESADTWRSDPTWQATYSQLVCDTVTDSLFSDDSTQHASQGHVDHHVQPPMHPMQDDNPMQFRQQPMQSSMQHNDLMQHMEPMQGVASVGEAGYTSMHGGMAIGYPCDQGWWDSLAAAVNMQPMQMAAAAQHFLSSYGGHAAVLAAFTAGEKQPLPLAGVTECEHAYGAPMYAPMQVATAVPAAAAGPLPQAAQPAAALRDAGLDAMAVSPPALQSVTLQGQGRQDNPFSVAAEAPSSGASSACPQCGATVATAGACSCAGAVSTAQPWPTAAATPAAQPAQVGAPLISACGAAPSEVGCAGQPRQITHAMSPNSQKSSPIRAA